MRQRTWPFRCRVNLLPHRARDVLLGDVCEEAARQRQGVVVGHELVAHVLRGDLLFAQNPGK